MQVNERSRFIGSRIPAGLRPARLYVDSVPNDGNLIETTAPAVLRLAGQANRTWRGVTIEPFAFKTIQGWKPDLTPPPDSPFYQWRLLN